MFLVHVTAAKYGRDYFEATGKKTTNLACTNATKVGLFPIPLPRLAEHAEEADGPLRHGRAGGSLPARPASTIFPRFHQSRLVRRVAEDITAHFVTAGDIGKKYLADHSAGSGKTLSICWLADRLHSLYKPPGNHRDTQRVRGE